MRLLQCCEWADTGEDEGRKKHTVLCSAPDMCKDIFFYCYCITAMFEDISYSKHAVAYRHKNVVHFIVLLK